MPNEPTDAEAKLRKLSERLRDGWAKQHPTPEENMDVVRNAIREQWEKELQKDPLTPSDLEPRQKPPEPDVGR